MLVRIISGAVALIVFLPFLVHSDTIAYPIAMGICAVIACYELIRCVGLHKKPYITLPIVAAAAALPLCVRLLDAYYAFGIAIAATLVLMLYILAITTFSHGKINIEQSSTTLLVSLYIIAAFSAMVYLRDFSAAGKYLFLLSFIGAWVPDTFAYFTGRLLGKHKLIPDVSPKKTVEGAIGGAVFCILAFIGFALVFNALNACACDEPCTHLPEIPVWLMAVAGLLSALVSMVGDLAMSVIKRHFGIKDYGNIMPGHGGALDRFDSVLAVALILAVAFGIASHAGVM